MRASMLMICLLLVGLVGGPPPAAALPGRAVCEGYCAFVGAGCFVFLGIFMGKDKCEAMYEGCVEGCVAGLLEAEPERD